MKIRLIVSVFTFFVSSLFFSNFLFASKSDVFIGVNKAIVADSLDSKQHYNYIVGGAYNSFRLQYGNYLGYDKFSFYYNFTVLEELGLHLGYTQYGIFKKIPYYESGFSDGFTKDVVAGFSINYFSRLSFYADYEFKNYRFIVGLRLFLFKKDTDSLNKNTLRKTNPTPDNKGLKKDR